MVGVQWRGYELQHAAQRPQPFRSNAALVHDEGKHVIVNAKYSNARRSLPSTIETNSVGRSTSGVEHSH